MQVLVTGATGFIGSAIVRELHAAGHDVLGLARTDEAASKLRSIGVRAYRAELTDVADLAAAAARCDGVVHTAFMRAPTGYASRGAANSVADFALIDREAIEAMGRAMAGSGRPLVITSGTLVLAPNRLGTEADPGDPASPAGARLASEVAAIALAAADVRTCIVRLPPVVHGEGDRGFLPALISVARKTGRSAYAGSGLNLWPAVHLRDAAQVFRLVLERGDAGRRYHAIGEEGIPFRRIAEIIAQRLGVEAVACTSDEVAADYGRLGSLIALHAPASSARTREDLEWHPDWPNLAADLETLSYFGH